MRRRAGREAAVATSCKSPSLPSSSDRRLRAPQLGHRGDRRPSSPPSPSLTPRHKLLPGQRAETASERPPSEGPRPKKTPEVADH